MRSCTEVSKQRESHRGSRCSSTMWSAKEADAVKGRGPRRHKRHASPAGVQPVAERPAQRCAAMGSTACTPERPSMSVYCLCRTRTDQRATSVRLLMTWHRLLLLLKTDIATNASLVPKGLGRAHIRFAFLADQRSGAVTWHQSSVHLAPKNLLLYCCWHIHLLGAREIGACAAEAQHTCAMACAAVVPGMEWCAGPGAWRCSCSAVHWHCTHLHGSAGCLWDPSRSFKPSARFSRPGSRSSELEACRHAHKIAHSLLPSYTSGRRGLEAACVIRKAPRHRA